MSDLESKHNAVARRYGGVLSTLAHENNVLKDVLKEAARLHQCCLQDAAAWNRVTSPTTPLKIQLQIIEKLAVSLKLGKLITQFLRVVCHNRRLQTLVFMLEDFMDRCKETVEGTVETAMELSQQDIERLQDALKYRLKKDVSLRQILKESLLGGLVLRVGPLMIDASIGAQLNKLRYVMKG